jgi:hypothetical protein
VKGGGYLRCVRINLVPCWTTVDGIANILIDHLEYSCLCKIKVFEPRFLDGAFLDKEASAMGILLSNWDGVTFFNDEGVLVSVDSGVNTQGEDMLMVGCQYLVVDNCSVGTSFLVH